MTPVEPLVDAVDRLLDRLYRDMRLLSPAAAGSVSPAMMEAIEMTRRAYMRERFDRGELYSDFPQVCEVED